MALSPVSAVEVLAVLTRKSRPFQKLGLELLDARPGFLRLAARVREEMLGGHNLCEGGYIFTIADIACAFACMTRNEETVTQAANITYISPARQNERLVAEAREISRTKKTAIYDVTVKSDDDRLIALFRGQCALLGNPVVSS
jgi:acyl-CoA thioesterase